MNVIRGLTLAIVVMALTLFCVANAGFVPIDLGFQQFDIWLPLLILVVFLLGFLPTWAWYMADRILLRRRLARAEQNVVQLETQLSETRVQLLGANNPEAVTGVTQP